MASPTVVLFHVGALRVADNPMLTWAARRGPVLPLFAWTPPEDNPWQPGAASRWWLHHWLHSLASELERLGSALIVRAGESTAQILAEVVATSGVRGVALPAPITCDEQRRDTAIEWALASSDVTRVRFNT